MTRKRIREQLTVQYDGPCDVCGDEDASGYCRVVYDVSDIEYDDGGETLVQRECFDCNAEAKTRDHQRDREEFTPNLI